MHCWRGPCILLCWWRKWDIQLAWLIHVGQRNSPLNQNGLELPCERISIMDDCPPCCLDDYLCYENVERDSETTGNQINVLLLRKKGHMGETHIQLRVVYWICSTYYRQDSTTVAIYHLERRKRIWMGENHLRLLSLSLYPKQTLLDRNSRILWISGVQSCSETRRQSPYWLSICFFKPM